jgi:hypothetical protein
MIFHTLQRLANCYTSISIFFTLVLRACDVRHESALLREAECPQLAAQTELEGAISLRASAVANATEGAISLGAISLGAISLGAISLGAISLGAISLGAISLGAISLGAISFGAISFGAISPGASAVTNAIEGTSAMYKVQEAQSPRPRRATVDYIPDISDWWLQHCYHRQRLH